MKTRIFIFVVLCTVVEHSLFSQTRAQLTDSTEAFNETVQGLGFFVGPSTGVGLSYRFHNPSTTSMQFTFGIMSTKDDFFISVGMGLQQDLVMGRSSRFYIVGGIAYFHTGKSANEYEGPFRIGAGIGGELRALDALHFSAEGIFTLFSDGSIYPVPQCGIHYYF